MISRHILAAVLFVTTIAAASVFAGLNGATGEGNRCLTHDDVLAHMHRSRNGVSLGCTDADLPGTEEAAAR